MRHSIHTRIHKDRAGRLGRRSGFSLIEVMISITIFSVVIGAVSTSMARGFALGESTHDKAQASNAAESAILGVIGEEFGEAFARFNASAADDPVGVGVSPSPGSGFAVRGLEPIAADADGLVGEILFPGDGIELREDVVDPELGMPRDLNGDGVIDGMDHSADYNVLPVRVRVQWRGGGGDVQVDLVTTVVGM